MTISHVCQGGVGRSIRLDATAFGLEYRQAAWVAKIDMQPI